MQEEIEQRSVTLVINASKLTARTLKNAMSHFLRYVKEKQQKKSGYKQVKPTGKQSVKELVGQNQGVSNIEVASSGIKDFEKVARKYGVDYAVREDKSGEKPKYLVFFKARDSDALLAAFREYTGKVMGRKRNGQERTDVLEQLAVKKAECKGEPTKIRNKEPER